MHVQWSQLCNGAKTYYYITHTLPGWLPHCRPILQATAPGDGREEGVGGAIQYMKVVARELPCD